MAYYNNYFPQSNGQSPYYQQPTQNQFSYNAPTQPSSDIKWVQGEAAARAYPVGAGSSVLLMDSEDEVFYVKSSDSSGMPLPLRIFEYKEKVIEPPRSKNEPPVEYVTKEEFEKKINELKKILIYKEEEGKKNE